METKRKIFVGSSSESLNEARFIQKMIDKRPGMEAVVWNSDAFDVGRTLLETIESLPFDYHGAVFLVTPDVSCVRNEKKFNAPVANVVFEYGYLAARLTRDRVAICQFENAQIPSDLGGIKVIEIRKYRKKSASALPRNARKELTTWLQRLPTGVVGIPAISQVHGYSGTWNVESKFSLWRGLSVKGQDKIFWEGKAFLVLQEGGERGFGIQVGNLYIAVGKYRARYEVVNEILAASVNKNGNLKLRVRVIRREGPKDKVGTLSALRLRQPLARKDFEIVLKPARDERNELATKQLIGTHEYRSATTVYQKAEEHWEYSGLLGPCCL